MDTNKNGVTTPKETVVKATNGATTKPVVSTVVPAAEIKPPVVNPKAEEQKPPLPSIEKRIEKLHSLNQVLEKREKIVEALENIKGFYIAPTGSSCVLKLTDSKGESFSISNSNVVGEMIALAKTKLNNELEIIDNQFNFSI